MSQRTTRTLDAIENLMLLHGVERTATLNLIREIRTAIARLESSDARLDASRVEASKSFPVEKRCRVCGGDGKCDGARCEDCQGAGWVRVR